MIWPDEEDPWPPKMAHAIMTKIIPTIAMTILNGDDTPSMTFPSILVMASKGFSCFALAD